MKTLLVLAPASALVLGLINWFVTSIAPRLCPLLEAAGKACQ